MRGNELDKQGGENVGDEDNTLWGGRVDNVSSGREDNDIAEVTSATSHKKGDFFEESLLTTIGDVPVRSLPRGMLEEGAYTV